MNALAKARKFHESASVLNDVMFMCQVLLFRHQKANSCQLESLLSKLASTFVRAFAEEKLTPLNSW